MLQLHIASIEQLDLALDQLVLFDPSFDRFALMLTDNVVELTLYEYIELKLSYSHCWGNPETIEHDFIEIEKGIGKSFCEKLKIAKGFDILDSKTYDSILNLHEFRNTAYHRGLRHEGILRSLAIFYFQNACNLLKKHASECILYDNTDKISYRVRKHFGDINLFNPAEQCIATYDRLYATSVSMNANLVHDLYIDMEKTIDNINEDINLMIKNTTKNMNRKEIIIQIQEQHPASTNKNKKFPKIRNDPIKGWHARARSLSKESDPHKALSLYCNFMQQIEYLQSTLRNATKVLHIRDQIRLMDSGEI